MVFVRRLVWDLWNTEHVARHKVIPEEVEEVCHGEHKTFETYGGRLLVIGYTKKRRPLVVIIAERGTQDAYYPVTARTAGTKERTLLAQPITNLSPTP